MATGKALEGKPVGQRGRLSLLGIVIFAMAGSVSAKTVALWPLNVNKDGSLDGRCAVHPANDLTYSTTATKERSGTAWSVPPNPDSGVHVFTPYDIGAVSAPSGGSPMAKGTSATPALFNALCCTNDFTVEGWIRLDALPAVGSYISLFESRVGGNQIFWTIRQRKDSADNSFYTFECYWRGNSSEGSPGGDNTLCTIGGDASAYLGQWHHVALTRFVEGAYTKLAMYVDGVRVADPVSVSKLSKLNSESFEVYLGGRSNMGTAAALNYWRVSDVALNPSEFLNAPGTGGQAYDLPVGKETVAYWPLRKQADGTIDYRDHAGTAHLSTGFQEDTTKCYEMTLERGVSAFKGQPPNSAILIPTDTEQGLHVPNGNQDSLGAFRYPTFGRIYKLGSSPRADPHSASFTLEAYYRPSLREQTYASTTDESVATFWTSMDKGTTTNGWSLQIVRDAEGLAGGSSRWRLVFMDSASTAGDTSTYVAAGDFTGGTFREGDNIWRHIALAYDKTGGAGGFGEWRLYVDGAACGTVANVRAPAAKTNGEYVYLAGNGGLPGQVYGYFDCIAYSEGAAISPEKFLCETNNPTANNKLKALLPLDADVLNDMMAYTRCVRGNTFFYFQYTYNRSMHPVACDNGPVVTNPDPLFNQTGAVGGATFQSGSDGAKSMLMTRDGRVLELFSDGGKDMTIEGFFKRNAAIGSEWHICFAAYALNGTADAALFMTSYRANNRMQISDSAIDKGGDSYFNSAENPLSDMNDWTHLAWVRKSRSWTLYQNGNLVGTVSAGTRKTLNAQALRIGGRMEHTWRGDMAEIRISRGALATNEFLCAAPQVQNPPPPAEADGTQAFWYLDGEGASVDLANATMASGAFSFAGTAQGGAPAGMSRHADDSGLFDDSSRPNAGSVAVSASPLTASRLGDDLDVTKTFTVEGWFRRTAATPVSGTEIVCGTWDGSAGWYLALVPGNDGKLHFAVRAQSLLTPYANGIFPVGAGPADGWHHLALVHDTDTGTWTLRVDDESLGEVACITPARFGSCGTHDFMLGSATFAGSFDIWRVSRVVRSPDSDDGALFKVLYKRERGTLIIFK